MKEIPCGSCGNPLPGFLFNLGEARPCPRCGVAVLADAYPAFLRADPAANAGQRLITDQEASCFYHRGKKAEISCDACGRFMCGLCDMEVDGRHLCPNCLQSASQKKSEKNQGNYRVLYDRATLAMAVLPILFLFITIVTAPTTIYMAVRYWNTPSSILGRSRTSFVVAIIFAVVEMLGWAAFFFFV